ncbi:MAG TPA: asparagine synthase-related protein [Pseudonocardiaceae bacterium]
MDGALTNGVSWLRPLTTPMLEIEWSGWGAGVRLLVRERRSEMVSALSRDWVEVRVSPGTVRFEAGAGGTAPLYLASVGGVVHGTWNLPDVCRQVRADDLLDRVVARVLARRPRYSSDTLFRDVVMLSERAVVNVTRSGVSVRYPSPAEHVLAPRRPRRGIDLVYAFGQLLDAAVRGAAPDDQRVGVELSGGADSMNVALSAVRSGLAVTCFGLLLDEADDDRIHGGQQRRRAAALSFLGTPDVAVRAAGHPPLAAGGIRAVGSPHDPCAAYYREAFDAMRDAAIGRVTVMLTGLGGDELLAARRERRSGSDPVVPWLGRRARLAMGDVDVNVAPVPVVPLSTLMSLALHNPAYHGVGIWPVSPMADAALVRFGEQLPAQWTEGKTLLRTRLRRAGLPAWVTHPRRPETFGPLMQVGLRRYGLRLGARMLRESVLVDCGFVDHRRLAEACEAAAASARIPSVLCDTICLEVGVRSLVGRPLRWSGD